MELTKKELKRLELLLKIKADKSSIMVIFFLCWKGELILLIATCAGAVFFFWGGWPIIASFFLGSAFSGLSSYVGNSIARVKAWRLSEQITDWDTVNQLVDIARKQECNKK